MHKLSTDIIYNYGKVETLVMYQSWDKTDIYKTVMSTVPSVSVSQ